MKNDNSSINKVVDTAIRLISLGLIAYLCVSILKPFINPLFWGIIFAVALDPFYRKIDQLIGHKSKITSIITVLLTFMVISMPLYLFLESAIRGITDIGSMYASGKFLIQTPNESIKAIPLIGDWIYDSWQLASQNLPSLLNQYQDYLKQFGLFLLDSILGTGITIINLALSVLIAGILLYSKGTNKVVYKLFEKIAGDFGVEFASITEQTIRNVVKGILGVAVIQATLAGFGFLMVDLPYAGLWVLICLILTIIQVGPGFVIIPVIIWLFLTRELVPASIWSTYLVIVMLLDNILKPIFLGKGASVPTVVIFLGAIGGFLFKGFLGLFLGAIILSITYKLLITWLGLESINTENTIINEEPSKTE
ncbi:MAG: AI-2E family transporter [Cyclobacteriaceae bacterium]|jgi:predicted PurR-regulated permease PerM|tara:strand:- start:1192 stop:2289 length:1098 start_codon:yes stop_codon:yes gene_type:complete